MTDPQSQSFRVGHVLSVGFAQVFRNIVPFGGTALIVMLPAAAIVQALRLVELSVSQSIVLSFASVTLSFLFAYVATAGIAHGAIGALRGERPQLGDCLAAAIGVVFPTLGIAGLVALAVVGCVLPGILLGLLASSGFSYLLFFVSLVPVLALLTIWWLAVPACAVERPGVVASLRRSAALTKGERWRAFGIIVVVMLINWGLSMLANILGAQLYAIGGSTIAGAVAGGLVALIVTAFHAALNAVMAAVAYHDLRAAKEGLGVEPIAAVFD